MRKTIFNQNGLSIISALIATAILSVAILVSTHFADNSSALHARLKFNSDFDALAQTMRLELGKPVICAKSLGSLTLNAATPTPVPIVYSFDLSSQPTAILFQPGSVAGALGHESASLSVVNEQPGKKFLVTLSFSVSAKGLLKGVSSGRKIYISALTDASNVITSCMSILDIPAAIPPPTNLKCLPPTSATGVDSSGNLICATTPVAPTPTPSTPPIPTVPFINCTGLQHGKHCLKAAIANVCTAVDYNLIGGVNYKYVCPSKYWASYFCFDGKIFVTAKEAYFGSQTATAPNSTINTCSF